MHRYFTIQDWSLGKYLHIGTGTQCLLSTKNSGSTAQGSHVYACSALTVSIQYPSNTSIPCTKEQALQL